MDIGPEYRTSLLHTQHLHNAASISTVWEPARPPTAKQQQQDHLLPGTTKKREYVVLGPTATQFHSFGKHTQ